MMKDQVLTSLASLSARTMMIVMVLMIAVSLVNGQQTCTCSPPPFVPTGQTFTPTGVTLNGQAFLSWSGYPLAGITVQAYSVTGYPLGEVNTTGDGGFAIVLPFNASYLLTFINKEDARNGGSVGLVQNFYSTPAKSSGPTSLTYESYIITPGNATLWTAAQSAANQALRSLPDLFANRTGLFRLSDIFTQLVATPGLQSVFGSQFNLLTRHALANLLEQSFADPTGTLRSTSLALPTLFSIQTTGDAYFNSLASGRYGTPASLNEASLSLKSLLDTFESPLKSDWIVDVSLASTPNAMFSKARTQYGGALSDILIQGGNQPVPTGPDSNYPFPGYYLPDTNLINYRNYLRNIFTGASDLSGFPAKHGDLIRRFKQQFNGSATNLVPVNTIMVPIVKSILTSATGNQYGFGFNTASIPAQGAKTTREYLDTLIQLTGLSASELSIRYRADFTRSDDVKSSQVAENIATLQAFYRDGYQAKPDPYPIFPISQQGYAPFFLFYSEWLQEGTFFPENHYDISQTFYTGIKKDSRNALNRTDESYFVMSFFPVEDGINYAMKKIQQGEYQMAYEKLLTVVDIIDDLIRYYIYHTKPASENWAVNDASDLAWYKNYYPSYTVKTENNLKSWMNLFRKPEYDKSSENNISPHSEFEVDWLLVGAVPRTYVHAIHASAYVLPVLLGDVLLNMGRYAEAQSYYAIASRIMIGRLDADGLVSGTSGSLPYTLNIRNDAKTGAIWETNPVSYPDAFYWLDSASKAIATAIAHPFEKRFFRLKHANALLEWADELYRTDDEANTQRARELYKAVLFIHGAPPAISPSWSTPSGPYDAAYAYKYFPSSGNPAILSQIKRANLGYTKILQGFNYFGVSDSYVPAARYTVLQKAALQSGTQAKAAQADFVSYLSNIEDEIRQNVQNTAAIRQANLQAQIAQERQQVANYDIQVAQNQVQQVNAQIDAKKQEIEDHDSFWTQLGDFCSGFVGALSSVPGAGSVGSSAASAVGLGELASLAGGSTAGATTAAAGGAAASGLGIAAAAAPLGAYALFVYAGISSLNSMASSQEQRYKQLHQLQDVALPLAQGLVKQKQNEFNIAKLEQQIAESDAELAMELMAFDASKTLSIDFWSRVNAVLRRVLRRYLETGAQQAWFAQRALSFQIGQDIDIIRMDYFPADLQGVTGADQLLSDINSLDEVRVSSIHTSVPIKHTYSLAFDMPIAFGQLKQAGEVNFWTFSSVLQAAYPGTYAHRIVSVDIVVKTMSGVYPARGILTNGGFSFSPVENKNQPQQALARFPDARPVSEFQMRQDMGVHGLPGDALVNFEGSGPETSWTLAFPLEANPPDFLDKLADVQITFDYHARYSTALLASQLGSAAAVNHFPIFLLGSVNPAALQALTNSNSSSSSIDLTWDLGSIKSKSLFSKKESNLKVTNVLVSFVTWGGVAMPNVTATLTSGVKTASFAISQNYAVSNNPKVAADAPSVPSSLNTFAGQAVVQPWTLTINPSANTGVDFSKVIDVVLGVDYTATRAASPLF